VGRRVLDRGRRLAPPDCSLLALSLYGGDDHVTCRNCGHVIPQDRYGFYVRLLVDEEEERKRRAAEKEPAA
jgi:adenine-specific DNA methylase